MFTFLKNALNKIKSIFSFSSKSQERQINPKNMEIPANKADDEA